MCAFPGLTLCGQKENVQEMIASIQKRLAQQLQADLMPSNEKRQSCGLPVNTDRFPTYWNVRFVLTRPTVSLFPIYTCGLCVSVFLLFQWNLFYFCILLFAVVELHVVILSCGFPVVAS